MLNDDKTYRCDDDRCARTLGYESINWTAGPIFFHHTVHNTMGSPLRPTQSKQNRNTCTRQGNHIFAALSVEKEEVFCLYIIFDRVRDDNEI